MHTQRQVFPRNRESRIVPLSSELAMILAGLRSNMNPKESVFDDTNLRTEWARACAAFEVGKDGAVQGTSGIVTLG